MRKEIIASILCIVMCLLCACGEKEAEIQNNDELIEYYLQSYDSQDDTAEPDENEASKNSDIFTYKGLDLVSVEEYDESGNIISYKEYDGDEITKSVSYEYIFDSSGRAILQSEFTNETKISTKEISYDKDGNITTVSTVKYNSDSIDMCKTEYLYSSGVLVEKKEYDTDDEGLLYLRWYIKYDSNGNKVESGRYSWSDNHYLESKTLYDKNGNILEDYKGDAESLCLIKKNVYNSNGDCLTEYKYINGNQVVVESNKYNADGEIILSQQYDNEGNVISETNYTYDTDGSYKAYTKNTYEDWQWEYFEEYSANDLTLLTYSINTNDDGSKIMDEEEKLTYNEDGKIISDSGFVIYEEDGGLIRNYEMNQTWKNGKCIKSEAHGFGEDREILGEWFDINHLVYLFNYTYECIFDGDLIVERHEYKNALTDEYDLTEIENETRTVYEYYPNGETKSIKTYSLENEECFEDKTEIDILRERNIIK